MFFLDAHTHFYPCYSPVRFFRAAFRNIDTIFKSTKIKCAASGIILTERNDCNFYTQIQSDRSLQSSIKESNFEIEGTTIYDLQYPSSPSITLYPGRQVNSRENVEVLALLRSDPLPEDCSLNELLTRIQNSGALPVINWAPGKWLGKRGKIVSEIIEQRSSEIFLGITSLLPVGFPFPRMFLRGEKLGVSIVAGSDPLPFAGQEELVGSYGMGFQHIGGTPQLSELRKHLDSKAYELLGQRDKILSVLVRILRNELVRHRL